MCACAINHWDYLQEEKERGGGGRVARFTSAIGFFICASFQRSKVVKVAADWGCHNTEISIADTNIRAISQYSVLVSIPQLYSKCLKLGHKLRKLWWLLLFGQDIS